MNRLSEPAHRRSPCADPAAKSVHAVLRAATEAQHAAAARIPAMQRVFAVDFTIAEYAGHLARLVGFHEPLEREAARHARTGAFRHRIGRSDALFADLRKMRWTRNEIDAIPRHTQVTPLTAAGAWGYLYVVLGSMLGGRVIARRLTAVLGPAVPLQFYAAAATDENARWIAFCRDLDRTQAADLTEICVAARATFDLYTAWMDQPPRARAADRSW